MKRPDFKHILVLKNPASTNIRTAERHIAEIRKIFPQSSFTVVQAASAAQETCKRLTAHQELLGPKTLFCVAGGDGTVNQVVEFLLGCKDLEGAACKTVLLPLWAGNANDFAHMANGPSFRIRLPLLFKQAQVTPVYPLECKLTAPNGRTHIYHAASYAGFGATAVMAREMNRREHRRRWWQRLAISKIIGEIVIVGRIILGSSSFTLEENGKQQLVYERSYVNGTRMGRLQPFAASLTEKVFIQTTVPKSNKRLKAFYRWLSGNMRPVPTRRTNRTNSFATKDSIWMQADGEPMRVQKNTQISVRCSPVPVYVLGTRLTRSKAHSKTKKSRRALHR